MHPQTKYYRTGSIIRNRQTGEDGDFHSINKAKRESHSLQLQNGGLGNGSLRLVTKLPAADEDI